MEMGGPLGVAATVVGLSLPLLISSHASWETFPVKSLSLQKVLKSLPTRTTCEFAMPQKGLLVIQSQGLLRKSYSRHLCETQSLGLKYPSSEGTMPASLSGALVYLKAARTASKQGQLGVHSGTPLPARKAFKMSCTHLQVPLVCSKFELQWDRGDVLGPGAPTLQSVLEQHKGRDSALGQLQKSSLEMTTTGQLNRELLRYQCFKGTKKGPRQRYRHVLHLPWNAGQGGKRVALACCCKLQASYWRLGETDHRIELPSSSASPQIVHYSFHSTVTKLILLHKKIKTTSSS